uniref:Protein kinase domain-containing protein n=1 Tax=viral metagenome TaxID=1070528 RepID=A0A6C0BPN5_9ZZZZ
MYEGLVAWLQKLGGGVDFGIARYLETSTKLLTCEANYRISGELKKLQESFVTKTPPVNLPRRGRKRLGSGVRNTAYLYDGHVFKTSTRAKDPYLLGEALLQGFLWYPEFRHEYQTILNKYVQVVNTNPPKPLRDYPIPRLYRYFHTPDGRVWMEYEFIPEMLLDRILKHGLSPMAFQDILYQIMVHLMILQSMVQFSHRDFHPNNLAIRLRSVPRQIRYTMDGHSKTLTSTYQVYFLDLETACIDASNLRLIGKNINSPNAYYNTCQNQSFDMQVFLSWAHVMEILPKTPAYIRTLAKQAYDDLKICHVPKTVSARYRHLARVQRSYLNISNIPALYPKNMLDALLQRKYTPGRFHYEPIHPTVPPDCDIQRPTIRRNKPQDKPEQDQQDCVIL